MKILKADSGITVLYRQVPGNLVSARYYVNCGSLDEQDIEEHGLCHALEHMFFAGTRSRTWEDIIRDFRRLGAYSNASTGHMCTEYEFLVPAENFGGAFEIAADMMYNSTFPEERWETVEKKAVINELLGYDTSPEWVLENESFVHALGGLDKYHHPGGNIDSVEKASIEDLIRFRNRFYKGDNIFLSIAGGISEEKVLSVVNEFDKWDPALPEERALEEYAFNSECRDGFKEGCGQPFIHVLKPVRKILDDEGIACREIFESLLNNHLMMEVREKKGLCYGIHAEIFDELSGPDYLNIATSATDHESKDLIIDAMYEAITSMDLDESSILEARMDTYRNLLIAQNLPEAISTWMGEEWLRGKKEDPIKAANYYIKKVSANQVQELAVEFLNGEYKVSTLEDLSQCEED